MVAVILVNYTIDPGNIYRKNNGAKNNSSNSFAKKLMHSKFGLLHPDDSWNDRDIKVSIAQQIKNINCAVIGSSHVLQISSFRKEKSLSSLCDNLINLWVPGGTLEDYLALSWELINNPHSPQTIIFGIAVWSLDFNRDSRWLKYKLSYQSMREKLLQDRKKKNIGNSFTLKYVTNLINPDYFFRSLSRLGENHPVIREAPKFDYNIGITDPVILPDGSTVPSKNYIKNAQDIVKDGNRIMGYPPGLYKIRRDKVGARQYNEDAVELFTLLIKHLRSKGKKIVLLMTPYHHATWADDRSLEVNALKEVEFIVRNLGDKIGVQVLGSHNPAVIGCDTDEFYDYRHAKASCLSKLDQ